MCRCFFLISIFLIFNLNLSFFYCCQKKWLESLQEYMIKELAMNRKDIEESLNKCLHNNIMACYLMLSRNSGFYNNRQLVAEVSIVHFFSVFNFLALYLILVLNRPIFFTLI